MLVKGKRGLSVRAAGGFLTTPAPSNDLIKTLVCTFNRDTNQ